MTAEEAKSALKHLNQLFPLRVNIEQGKVFLRDVLPFDFSVAKRCIEQHRMAMPTKNGFSPEPSFPVLFEAMRSSDRAGREAAKARPQARPEESWADVHRRMSPSESMRSANNFEVCLRVYRIWWCMGHRQYRANLERRCVYTLQDMGIADPAERERMVAAVFDDSDDYFRMVLSELRGELVPA